MPPGQPTPPQKPAAAPTDSRESVGKKQPARTPLHADLQVMAKVDRILSPLSEQQRVLGWIVSAYSVEPIEPERLAVKT
jgi:hypothetical protein